MRKFSEHHIFKHPIFRTQQYRDFAQQLSAHLGANPFASYSQHIMAVAPEIMEAIGHLNQRVTGDSAVLRAEVGHVKDAQMGGLDRIESTLGSVVSSAQAERLAAFRAASQNLLRNNSLPEEASQALNAALSSLENQLIMPETEAEPVSRDSNSVEFIKWPQV